MWPNTFFRNYQYTAVAPMICATFVVFKSQPKVSNRPIGESSPNQVTLLTTKKRRKKTGKKNKTTERALLLCTQRHGFKSRSVVVRVTGFLC
jgi:hypothetical protein